MTVISRVQSASRSWVKPATPTPFYKDRTELSDWDTVMFASYISILLFYTNDNKDPNFMNTDILKNSLSKVLNDFYPLAGRLVDLGNGRDIIDNSDEGVLFVEAKCSQNLEKFKQEGYLPSHMDYHHMFPIHFYRSPQDPLLAVQVTRFTDGGVALGVMILHKVADIYSASYFLDAWSKTSRGTTFAYAAFDRSLILFPKDTIITDEAMEHYYQEHRTPTHVNNRFKKMNRSHSSMKTLSSSLKTIILQFNSAGLQACKKDAHTPEMIANKEWLSTKEVLLAMLYRAVVKSRDLPEEAVVSMVTSLNGRTKMKNHKEMSYYFGNWMISRTFKTSLKDIKQLPLVNTAISFRQIVANLQYNLFHGISKLYTLHEDMSVNYLTYQPNSEFQTTISDVSMLPFWNADFGFGRPDSARSYIAFGGNGSLILFGRGPEDPSDIVYEVQLQMDTESIRRLIQDPNVLKYSKKIIY
ncbi:hypothetical protein G6F46_001481 [Rhizopus delemar]|uniref:Choline/carnitine acyltransferase domain-containing protein n=3 Tax=Rhizopus TaxID=4842 RepID=I1C6G5_RHIO9|nr:hypothetical protein RO3G_08750 [Rhizopus delemar RA 99-880]KAG1465139.1 hypothetical protein G6F55_001331 [Rhizopus delemar]KAG1551956.1 hypothetical protein G6F51_001524 [Rhizopus arrhizus]KAG1503311.1 hypothetical protein G6F54_001760 [Rhizopus delemar]KAG1518362.1 hypothetical protein G6F53_000653 [Rhizopus delemar]|eukprot:EIE84045.1 hypothetical protein RO3G_08750 [Rhizopus delemar RA 99-880]